MYRGPMQGRTFSALVLCETSTNEEATPMMKQLKDRVK